MAAGARVGCAVPLRPRGEGSEQACGQCRRSRSGRGTATGAQLCATTAPVRRTRSSAWTAAPKTRATASPKRCATIGSSSGTAGSPATLCLRRATARYEPENSGRTWRAARGENFAWVAPRTFHKGAATVVDHAYGDPELAARRLGNTRAVANAHVHFCATIGVSDVTYPMGFLRGAAIARVAPMSNRLLHPPADPGVRCRSWRFRTIRPIAGCRRPFVAPTTLS